MNQKTVNTTTINKNNYQNDICYFIFGIIQNHILVVN